MRALLSATAGGPETLTIGTLATPEPGPGELRVRVLACALNFPDTLVIEDKYQFRPQRPFAPGSELSGVVEAIGEGVSGWAIGDRLIATVAMGGLAEQAIVAAVQAFRLPDGGDALEGAALLFTYGTTIHALADRGQLTAGETLLVLGAAGGIGLSGVEIRQGDGGARRRRGVERGEGGRRARLRRRRDAGLRPRAVRQGRLARARHAVQGRGRS